MQISDLLREWAVNVEGNEEDEENEEEEDRA